MNSKIKLVINTARISLIIACFAVALFFKLALVGYSVMALVFGGIGFLLVCAHAIVILNRSRAKTARLLNKILLGLVVVGLIVFTAAEIPVCSAARTDPDPEADYLIVLGAGVNGRVPSLSLQDRLKAALDYLHTYPRSIAVVSGGQGSDEDISEAEAMRLYLENKGIEPARIIMEAQASSTKENLSFSLKKIYEAGGSIDSQIAVVTSEYHLYRAKKIAHSLGFDPVGVAAKTSLPVLRLNYFIREALGVIYMSLGFV